MQFSCTQEQFSRGIQNVSRAVSVRPPFPALGGILLRVSAGRLSAAATDLEIGIECDIPAQPLDEGAVVLPGRYLADMARRLPAGEVMFRMEPAANSATISAGAVEFTLHGLPSTEFPLLPRPEQRATARVAASLLVEMIRQTTFAASHNEARPVFAGVLAELEGQELRLVATDVVRLAVRRGIVEAAPPAPLSVVIPARALNEVARLAADTEEVEIVFAENQVVFTMTALTIISRLVEGQFPNYRQVIPQERQARVTIARTALLEACERAALMTRDEDAPLVRLETHQDSLLVSAASREVGKVREKVPAVVEGAGVAAAFNAAYLIDALKVMGAEEVAFDMTSQARPSVVRQVGSDEYMYIVLPVILK